jgi:hypothetical protein
VRAGEAGRGGERARLLSAGLPAHLRRIGGHADDGARRFDDVDAHPLLEAEPRKPTSTQAQHQDEIARAGV